MHPVLDIRIALTTLVEHVHTRLSVDAVSVFIYDQSLHELDLLPGADFEKWHTDNIEFGWGRGFLDEWHWIRKSNTYRIMTQPGPAIQFPEPIAGEEFVSAFVVPLIAKGQLKGLLELFYRRSVRNNPEWKGFVDEFLRVKLRLQLMAFKYLINCNNPLLNNNLLRMQSLRVGLDCSNFEGWNRRVMRNE